MGASKRPAWDTYPEVPKCDKLLINYVATKRSASGWSGYVLFIAPLRRKHRNGSFLWNTSGFPPGSILCVSFLKVIRCITCVVVLDLGLMGPYVRYQGVAISSGCSMEVSCLMLTMTTLYVIVISCLGVLHQI